MKRRLAPAERHPWRVAEAALGFTALAALVTMGLIWPILESLDLHPPTLALTAQWEYALALATPLSWVFLFVGLGLTATGRNYLQSTANESLAQQNVASQPNNLTIAGLVLAALAVTSGKVQAGPAGQLLVASLAAFLLAWAIGAGPYRKSGMIASDAMHWSGLAMLLAAVAELSAASGISTGQSVAALVTGLVAIYSVTIARGYWRSSLPAPRRIDQSPKEPGT